MKKYILVVILLLSAWFVFFPSNLGHKDVQAASLDSTPISHLRCATFFDWAFTTDAERLDYLNRNVPRMKNNGFNCVFFIMEWIDFNPIALPAASRTWNEKHFSRLKSMFDIVRNNNMSILAGPNYYHFNPGGISGDWLKEPEMYAAFEAYIQEVMNRFVGYPISYFIHDEDVMAAGSYQGMTLDDIASLLQQTLGSLPSRLPTTLRSKVRIGYHRSWVSNTPQYNPIQMPPSFDFVSFAIYEGSSTPEPYLELVKSLTAQYRSLYPSLPLFYGEMGSTLVNRLPGGGLQTDENGYVCPRNSTELAASEDVQERALSLMATYAIDSGYGFNIWEWRPSTPNDYAAECRFGMHAITRGAYDPIGPVESFRPAVEALRNAFAPIINTGGINTDYQPWAVSLIGKNFSPYLYAVLEDNSQRWGGDIAITLAPDFTWLSFQLPSNVPPSGCNINATCTIIVRLVDKNTNLFSNSYPLVLPLITPTVKPSPSSTPIPTPIPPTPTTIPSTATPGDLDKNGKVDIFDYNLLIQNFGNTTCGNIADIDDNCKVDIFDYNILVGNFGK